MNAHFLGRIPFRDALAFQAKALLDVQSGIQDGIVMGFESDPIITLGLRGNENEDVAENASFSVERLDRGGQATLHNPGQLVIFPIYSVEKWGAKKWVEGLGEVTRQCVAEWKIESRWDVECPGLYTTRGKIMSCGVRLREGVSTHGVALNVNNDLNDFAQIRSCGISGAQMDKMNVLASLDEVFAVWIEKFKAHFDIQFPIRPRELTR